MDYKILYSYVKNNEEIHEPINDIVASIKAYIKEGWKPQGGIQRDYKYLLQSMIKE